MKGRCHRETHEYYGDYGGRGITVCPRWHDFAMFLQDMGEAPGKLSIERIDNNRGYEPGNCRWATQQEQAINRRSTIPVTIDGVTLPITHWAKRLGVHPGTATRRYKATQDAFYALGLKEKSA